MVLDEPSGAGCLTYDAISRHTVVDERSKSGATDFDAAREAFARKPRGAFAGFATSPVATALTNTLSA